MEQKQYKILVLVMSAYGHLNPIASLASELAKHKNLRVIFYGNEECRPVIEKTRAEYRAFKTDIGMLDLSIDYEKYPLKFPLDKFMGHLLDTADLMLGDFVRVVEEEAIDLIVYDFATMYATWLKQLLDKRHQAGLSARPCPPSISFWPVFVFKRDIFPNSEERKLFDQQNLSLDFIWTIINILWKYVYFCFKWGLPLANLEEMLMYKEGGRAICSVTPELHPRSFIYPKDVSFVGICASTELLETEDFDEALRSFLAPFEPRNPLPLVDLKMDEATRKKVSSGHRLIYASFGTLLNKDTRKFVKIIDAVKELNEEREFGRLNLLVSVGKHSYDDLQVQIENKQFELPENVLIRSRVPQLSILKRASLFITHCGQNSTSEAVHYGVPMVCVPILSDQPAVAHRVVDELGLGVMLSYRDLCTQHVRQAIEEIFRDDSFLERSLLHAKLSRKYNGAVKASQIVIDFLHNNLNKNDPEKQLLKKQA